jgi:hypothetical protein
VQGVLDDADHEGITVASRRLAYSDIERATTVFEWGPSPKPGAAQTKNKKKKKKEAATS